MKHLGVFLLVFMVFAASSNAYKVATIGIEPQNTIHLASLDSTDCTDQSCTTEQDSQELRLGLCAVPGFIETAKDFTFAQHDCERLKPFISHSFEGVMPTPVKRPPKHIFIV